ncbi:predicted protein [Arabidopsis lyrata subsp. lyrata]|uniref:Predicted protein n=1 Tax=Arabidopsis lyrata subsp. lyrata TaxID=81972 RepID=D7LHG6_ARALL|nr:predicted protein [Arabidopsis lyrata subsp. lyrata]
METRKSTTSDSGSSFNNEDYLTILRELKHLYQQVENYVERHLELKHNSWKRRIRSKRNNHEMSTPRKIPMQ